MIPAGGAGTRLWPRSRRSRPKHALRITGAKALLEETYDRVAPIADEVFVLTEAPQVQLVGEVLPRLGPDHLIVEPSARGTTNAYGLAAMFLLERDPEAVMLCAPADHLVRGAAAFRQAAQRSALVAARTGCLVTLGVKPAFAATGLGYIKTGRPIRAGGVKALRVDQFVEKPDQEHATRYLAAGNYYWNLAMFCWRAQSFVEELARLAPRHHAGLRRVLAARGRGDEAAAHRIYSRLPVAAVDYTVMERTDRLLLVPAHFDWLDVGSWSDYHAVRKQDSNGNSVDGPAVLIDTRGSLLSAPGKLVAAIGVTDLVVVDSPHALLIVPRARAQEVKKVVETLGRTGKVEYL